MKPMVILTGPTAVGKTKLSIQLAKRLNAEIISADSMQVYQKMNIGTAKVTKEEMEGIPHYLVDVLDPKEEFHVARFQQMAKEALDHIYAKGKIPLIVGGTGFYIQALLYDIDFAKEDPSSGYRKELEDIQKEKGAQVLHEQLAKVDEESAKAIHPNNVKKVMRALEFYHANGYPISVHNEKERQRTSPYQFAYFVLNDQREILYDRINRRVEQMVEEGLIDEVKHLREEGYGPELVSMQGIGYKEVFPYLDQKISKEEMVELIKKNTRHFAKRQLTWFRREKEVTFMDKSKVGQEEDLLVAMEDVLSRKGIIRE